jgi:hypothetical protein
LPAKLGRRYCRRARIERVAEASGELIAAFAYLVREALEIARDAGVENVHLTTRPHREAAYRLDRRLGFVMRDPDVFVWRPD